VRITLFTKLSVAILTLIPFLGLSHNLEDQTILKHLQSSSRHIIKTPSLWQVTHQKEDWSDTHLSYELLVNYQGPNQHPNLSVIHQSQNYRIKIHARSDDRRVLLLEGPLHNDESEDVPIESTQGISSHPLGTFDFPSIMPFSPKQYEKLFPALETERFGGQFQILQGRPTWIYDSDKSPWRIEIIRHHFFPARIIWKKTRNTIIAWQFKTQITYQPWGVADATLSEIVYSEKNDPHMTPATKTQTTWTLIRQFKNDADLNSWKMNVRNPSSSTYREPWGRRERLNILSAY
jgi:hypothetical protein